MAVVLKLVDRHGWRVGFPMRVRVSPTAPDFIGEFKKKY